MPHEDLSSIWARAQTRVGRLVREKWRIDALLGVGGMAAVYAATHRNGKRAALKFLHPELLISETLRTRFLREGHVANRVGHTGAVSVIDDDISEDGGAFLVMELLEGESLEQQWRAQGTLQCGDVLMIADQILDVLAAAHGKDIIHRDLKPANIFVCRDGAVKILDFGIARLREMSSSTSVPGAVTTMSSMGTPSFMPPEQARGRWEQVDARSDLWALGATMFSLLTGRFVHVEQTVNEQLLAGMTKPAPKLHDVAPELPTEIGDVVDRALSFAPEDRWPDARSMQEAVRDAYRAVSGKAMTQRRRVLFPPTDADASGEAATLTAQSAPTLAASSLSSPGPPVRAITTDASTPRRARSRTTMPLVGGAVLVVGAIAFVALRGGGGSRATTSSPPPRATTNVATTTDTTAPASPSPTAPAPEPTTTTSAMVTATATSETTPSAAAETAKNTLKVPLKNKATVLAAPSPPPSASSPPVASATPSSTTVDIFGRRR